MATQPHNPAAPPPKTPDNGPAPAPVVPSYPGGMASDPSVALANQIMTNIMGAPDRFRSQIESAPALKALMDQSNTDMMASIANDIRNLVNAEVAKATGGMAVAPPPAEKK